MAIWHGVMGRLGAESDCPQTSQTALFSAWFLCPIPDAATRLDMLSPAKGLETSTGLESDHFS